MKEENRKVKFIFFFLHTLKFLHLEPQVLHQRYLLYSVYLYSVYTVLTNKDSLVVRGHC